MHKPVALGLTCLSIGVLAAPNTTTKVVNLNSNLIGPYEEFHNDVNLSLKYMLTNSESKVTEKLKASNPETHETYFSYSRASHYVNAMAYYTVNFTLKLSDFFSKEGMQLDFSIQNSNTVFTTKKIVFYPITKETHYITRDKVKRLVSKRISFQFDEDELVYDWDDIYFVPFNDYINADNYYSLDLNENKFAYNYGTCSYKSAVISIEDKQKVFKYLEHNGNTINLPLKPISKNGHINFSFLNDFYVDANKLDTALNYIPGFVKTDKLFLPVNSKKKFLGSKIQIKLLGFGFNQYDLFFDLTYDAYKQLLGGCGSSDYCVKGEVE